LPSPTTHLTRPRTATPRRRISHLPMGRSHAFLIDPKGMRPCACLRLPRKIVDILGTSKIQMRSSTQLSYQSQFRSGVFEIQVNRQVVVLKHQFQMCAPSMWLQTPLVSGILAASLGVLPILSLFRDRLFINGLRTVWHSGYFRWR
jgi:hypothetical protein